METGNPEVDRIQRKEDRHESDCSNSRCTLSLPAIRHSGMQVDCEDDPRDKRECFLRIPTPVSAPCMFTPNRATDDDKRPDRESEHDEPVAPRIKRFGARKRTSQPIRRNARKTATAQRHRAPAARRRT